MCRHGQNPDQHSEKDQRAKKRKRGVQGMELKIRIALETMPCRQHKTSFCLRLATGRPVKSIVALPGARFQCFRQESNAANSGVEKSQENGAGDRDRTGDIQLGKLAFYR